MLAQPAVRTAVALLPLVTPGLPVQEFQRAKEVVFRDGNRTWSYREYTLVGWKIYFQASLWKHEKLVKDLNRELRRSFKGIRKSIPRKIVEKLERIPIWVSDEPDYPLREGERGVIPFHRSEDWLREHGLNPHMAPGIHVINPRAVLYDHKVFEWGPMTILHELAHAYHNLHLKLDHPGVTQAYERALEAGLYLRVPSRSDPKKKVEAYAATDKEEYFAELTEAYFGRNDWFPHTRSELEKYDPVGYAMIERAWSPEATE